MQNPWSLGQGLRPNSVSNCEFTAKAMGPRFKFCVCWGRGRPGGGGGVLIWSYIGHVFLLKIIVVCPRLTIITSFWYIYCKLSFGNIALNIYFILGNILRYSDCVYNKKNCMHFMCIINKTVNILKDWALKECRSFITRNIGPWS